MVNDENTVSLDGLFSIPVSAFCFHLCPYLAPTDILALRATSRRLCDALHKEQESETMWRMMLQRDFGCQMDNNPSSRQALNVQPKSTSTNSIFGVDPVRDDFIVQLDNAFDTWKQWVKVSARFYQVKGQYVPSGYYLRAARVWQTIHRWCEMGNPDHGGRSEPFPTGFRQRLLRSLREHDGLSASNWSSLIPKEEADEAWPGLDTCRAVYAFVGGQKGQYEVDVETAFLGLLGGYHAYGYYSCTHWVTPQAVPEVFPDEVGSFKVVVGVDPISHHQGLHKMFLLDASTGALYLRSSSQWDRAVQPATTADDEPGDDLLVWLEEYVRRLTTGCLRINTMGSHRTDPEAITLYPEFPWDATPRTTEGVEVVSRAVSKGVEVVASAVYVPQARLRFGFIYSIRIRLLSEGQEGYMPASERGFDTCQLFSRHWQITDDSTGQTDRVDGEGVIGMYPLLYEGGYHEGTQTRKGAFEYQSCTGRLEHGSFCGHLTFVPGRLNMPTGNRFDVELKPFELNNRPKFLF